MTSHCSFNKHSKLSSMAYETLVWPCWVPFLISYLFSHDSALAVLDFFQVSQRYIPASVGSLLCAGQFSSCLPPATAAWPHMCVLPVSTSELSLNISPSRSHSLWPLILLYIPFALQLLYQMCTLLVLWLLVLLQLYHFLLPVWLSSLLEFMPHEGRARFLLLTVLTAFERWKSLCWQIVTGPGELLGSCGTAVTSAGVHTGASRLPVSMKQGPRFRDLWLPSRDLAFVKCFVNSKVSQFLSVQSQLCWKYADSS